MSKLLDKLKESNLLKKKTFTIEEYLDKASKDKKYYMTPSERMLEAIGEPILVDTSTDSRLSRLFFNKKINVYPAFKEFYGMENIIEQIVSYFKHAAQGLEERKQILYLLGPVGSAKSSLADRLRHLMEKNPIYVVSYLNSDDTMEISPCFDSPLALFIEDKNLLEEEYNIPSRVVPQVCSPWLLKRLKQSNGDLSKFRVEEIYPSKQNQIANTRVEPSDENNQDISALVGKVDIRKLAKFAQDDADAYSYSGSLNRGNQGIMEFVEMFKAPIKTLHPLLTSTQENMYNGTESIGSLPFNGIVLSHSNESEWASFSQDKKNEAFLDRVYIVRVPYTLRINEEVEIYRKLLRESSLSKAPCAPKTLEMLAQFSIMSRLKEPEHSSLESKMKIYNGENLKEIDPQAKSLQEYQDVAGPNEGMNGISTRFAFKILSKTFNYDTEEIAANPVYLLHILENEIIKQQFSVKYQEGLLNIVKTVLSRNYYEFLTEEIQKAYVESYSELGQNIFDRYILYADAWLRDIDYRDSETGTLYNRDALNNELEKIEKLSSINNAKDFRNEIVNFNLRSMAKNGGKNIAWDSYEKMRSVIEKKLFSRTEDILPVISFGPKSNKDTEEKHTNFLKRMIERGYTTKQVRVLIDWLMMLKK